MAELSPRITFRGSRGAWLQSRFRALVGALQLRGIPFDYALPLAKAVVALWATETGWGREEYWYNAGNVHRGSWRGDTYVSHDSGAQVAFRAYATLDDAADDFVALMEGRTYRAAWFEFVRSPWGEQAAARWYQLITRAGYHPPSAESDAMYGRAWRAVATYAAAA